MIVDEEELVTDGFTTTYNDKPFTGIGQERWGDLVVCEITYLDGRQNGLCLSWYKDGTLRSIGFCVNFKLDGVEYAFSQSGMLKSEDWAIKGQPILEIEWNPNGKVRGKQVDSAYLSQIDSGREVLSTLFKKEHVESVFAHLKSLGITLPEYI